MKKVILSALCLCFLFSGCAAPDTSPEPSISVETVTTRSTAQDGTLLLERTSPLFKLTLPNADAAAAIEDDLQRCIDRWMSPSADLESYALSEYTGNTGWVTWFAKLNSQTARLDNQILSLYFEYTEFSGGNHPISAAHTLTYDCTSGQALKLEDILFPGYASTRLASLVNAALAPQATNLYDDYEALVGNAFANGEINWYLSNQGLCFIFDPYAIGPYSSGIIETTVAYTQLADALRPNYIPT